MELQMVLCRRLWGRGEGNIRSDVLEPALRMLARKLCDNKQSSVVISIQPTGKPTEDTSAQRTSPSKSI
jgi:hypothetical protein